MNDRNTRVIPLTSEGALLINIQLEQSKEQMPRGLSSNVARVSYENNYRRTH